MISSWRRRRAARRAQKVVLMAGSSDEEEAAASDQVELLTMPNHFQCPISLDLMKDPVTLSTGITYDRGSIEKWIESGNMTCPVTNQPLSIRSLDVSPICIPNHAIRRMIQDWCVENCSFGIERIPTPRIPVSPMDASEILNNIASTSSRGDRQGCIQSLAKFKSLVRESERNKRCFVTHGAGTVLSSAFKEFYNSSSSSSSSSSLLQENNVIVFEEILSVLPSMFPLDEDARSQLGSPIAMHCIVSLMRSAGLCTRRNSVLALKEIVSSSDSGGNQVEALAVIDGALEAIFELIKEPICPTATKASLVITYHITTLHPTPTNERIINRLVEMGLVNLLVETLIDADKSISEKVLGVLNGICNTELGIHTAYDNSLVIAVLVKKLLRVSDLATDFSVSILWKLLTTRISRNENEVGDDALVEALQVGAFQKLLLILQVGCGESTKEKATELMKLLNLHRDRLECIDSQDFKDLKRPF
ncbi:hypothetical protein SAY87_015560 [Trapa incisa]|uniref:U-box domain-containing protein n=1 Tax=Trapa incisa TaxID=236973 RepID=A0AAN7L7N3_9MYRT|nr:hypothetical protein SAY87_015560 [Trapa incisa]